MGIGAPFWVDDSDFDISDYIVKAPTDGLITRDRFDTILGNIMAKRIDRKRPLWKMTLIGPLEERIFGLSVKIDHILGDGYSALATIVSVLSDIHNAPCEHTEKKHVVQPRLKDFTLLRLAVWEWCHFSISRLLEIATMLRSREIREEIFRLVRITPKVIRTEFFSFAPKSELNRPLSPIMLENLRQIYMWELTGNGSFFQYDFQ